MISEMSFPQIKKGVASSLIAINFLVWADQSPAALESRSLQVDPPTEPRVVIEVLLICDGMCGAPRSSRFRLREDSTVEYLVSRSSWDEPGKADIILEKSTRLIKGEYDHLISLAESPEFLKSNAQYDSKIPLVDSSYLTVITYRNKEKLKKIYLKNYFPSTARSPEDPPNAVRQLVERVYEMCDKIGRT
jgi:hypothetical protein